MTNELLLHNAVFTSLNAGKIILSVYHEDHQVKLKDDRSPLTIADSLANEEITRSLKQSGIPVLSEEGKSIPYEERKNWNRFWMVDPLDGTKEFIKRNGEFTVNIALIEKNRPVMGVIYAPVPDVLYFGASDMGSFSLHNASVVLNTALADTISIEDIINKATLLPASQNKKNFTIIASRSHPSPETAAIIEQLKAEHGELDFISKGSSLKICLVAEGVADIYPRLAPTMEWDTAAGQAIAENAGCTMTNHHTGKTVIYNKENLLNPHFIVSRK